MNDKLTSELASLKIDRSAPVRSGRGLRILVTLAAVGALGWFGYERGLAMLRENIMKAEVQVTEVSSVSPAQASVELTSTGYVVPQVVSKVGAKISGRVSAVHVTEGQLVEKDALLVELDGADRQAQVRSAKARVASAQARVATARANVSETLIQAERQRKLSSVGAAPAANADDLEARAAALRESVKAAEAEVAAAQAEVQALQVDLTYMEIRAPITGTVMNKPPELGEMVGEGAPGSQPLEIADFRSIRVETDIPEGRLHMVKPGSPCEIVLDAFPKQRYRGEAVEISPRVDRAKASVKVKVKFLDDASGVLPDMSARVSFLTEALQADKLAEPPRTVVPESAVVERNGARVVFVVEGDSVRMSTVKLGPPFGGGFELLEGPPPGTKLVSEPSAELKDGQRIKEKT